MLDSGKGCWSATQQKLNKKICGKFTKNSGRAFYCTALKDGRKLDAKFGTLSTHKNRTT